MAILNSQNWSLHSKKLCMRASLMLTNVLELVCADCQLNKENMVHSRPVALFLDHSGPFWSIWSFGPKSQVLCTGHSGPKIKLGPCFFGPEKLGLDHGHSDQTSQAWTMIIRTEKNEFGP
jgi:hypothetical protein